MLKGFDSVLYFYVGTGTESIGDFLLFMEPIFGGCEHRRICERGVWNCLFARTSVFFLGGSFWSF